MLEKVLFLLYIVVTTYIYKNVSRETLKRSEDKNIYFNPVLKAYMIISKLNLSQRDSNSNF